MKTELEGAVSVEELIFKFGDAAIFWLGFLKVSYSFILLMINSTQNDH